MALPEPNARTGQSRDHGGQALLGSQASARQSLTARRSRAADRSGERHGRSIGVRVRPHRAPCGASLPVGRSVFESGRPETGVYPLTIRMLDEPGHWALTLRGHHQRGERQLGAHMIAHRPADDLARGKVEDRGEIEPSLSSGEWSRKRERFLSPNRTCAFQRIRLSIQPWLRAIATSR